MCPDVDDGSSTIIALSTSSKTERICREEEEEERRRMNAAFSSLEVRKSTGTGDPTLDSQRDKVSEWLGRFPN